MSDRKYSIKTVLLGLALAAGSLLPAVASAAEGFATANVNMRSGPSTRYPAVTVIPVGTSVEIHGCLSDQPWCDVSFYNGRGWVAGQYVQAEYRQSRVYVQPDYYDNLGIPIVTFELGTYWDRNYRNRNFYRERDYWRRGSDSYQVRDRDRRPRNDNNYERPRRDNNYERPRRDNNYERPRRTESEIIFDRPRDDNNFERPRRDRDRNRAENRRNDDNRDVRNNDRNNNRNRDNDRPRRNRDNDNKNRDSNQNNDNRYRDGKVNGRVIGGPQGGGAGCRPNDMNCN